MVLVVSMSGCISDSIFKEGITYKANGIEFQYPDSWHVVNTVAEGAKGAVADKKNPSISTVIQEVPTELGTDIQSACSNNNKNLVKSPNYINIQENKTTVKGKEVIVHRYLVNEPDGTQKEHVATWMKMSDNRVYVLLFSAPVSEYEFQRSSYDLVVGTFALQQDQKSSIFDSLSSAVNKFFTGSG